MTEEIFFTKSAGTGGRIKKRIADFKVKEVTVDGTVCEILAFDGDGAKQFLEKTWPETQTGDQLLLTMEKYNIDVNNAMRELSRRLRLSKKRFGYAGMKDKRAISSQKISIWKPDMEAVKSFSNRYVALRDAQWSDKRIELGDLLANEFEITIREIALDENEAKKRVLACIKELENGLPNYFGLQRFGGIRAVTHKVGREIIKEDLEKAVMIYLCETAPEEEEESQKARKALEQTRDFVQASKDFPFSLRFERALIHHLCKYPKDYAGAMQKLPKHLRIMFTHAYQSHLFNKVITKRLKQGIGLQGIEGDVLKDGIPTAPLYGFESILAEGKPGEIEKEVLSEEGLLLSEFKVKKLSELSSKGARKPLCLYPENLALVAVEKDEFSPEHTKVALTFRLSKGNYATTVVREIMKEEPR